MQKRSFFSVSLYKYEDCSFFFLKWLEQEAHLLYSRQNTKDEELSYHGGKTRLMSLSGSINKTKFLLPPKCLDQVNFTFSLRRFALYDGPKNKFITCAIISDFQFFQMFLPVFLVTLVFSWPVSFGLNTSFLKDRLLKVCSF